MKKILEEKLKRGFIKTEFLVIVVMVLISVLGIFIIISINQKEAEKRAGQRMSDFENLKTTLENYRISYGFYPSTGFSAANLKSTYNSRLRQTNTGERWNECDKSNNWIPSLNINLPSDPSSNCENRYDSYPRYEYVSDGRDYKIISYRLKGEICTREGYEEVIDPVRSCNNYDASWAIYSPGAKDW